MNIVNGNILNCAENIIVHQTNCLGVMGAGLALQIAERYPDVYKAYYFYCKQNLGNNILGTSLICETDDGKYVANVFGQLSFGSDRCFTDYDALEHGLKEVAEFAAERGYTIAVPYGLGCGLAGGDWGIVSKIIEEVLPNATVYRKD